MTYQIGIFNGLTGEEIVRDMTSEEQAARDAEIAAHLAAKELEAKIKAEQEEAKAALLERLGITQAEARLLLS